MIEHEQLVVGAAYWVVDLWPRVYGCQRPKHAVLHSGRKVRSGDMTFNLHDGMQFFLKQADANAAYRKNVLGSVRATRSADAAEATAALRLKPYDWEGLTAEEMDAVFAELRKLRASAARKKRYEEKYGAHPKKE